MTRDEAIYCMESYLPGDKTEHCVNCPYYGCIKLDNQLRVCKSNEAHEMAIEALENEPKTGHWIIIDDCEKFIAKCSECGQIEDSRMIHKYPYCHCGAKMLEIPTGERSK